VRESGSPSPSRYKITVTGYGLPGAYTLAKDSNGCVFTAISA
jgi:hypothetical protein